MRNLNEWKFIKEIFVEFNFYRDVIMLMYWVEFNKMCNDWMFEKVFYNGVFVFGIRENL